MKGVISSFRGEYQFLSNMAKATFCWDGRQYLNSEAAFQSAKTLDAKERDAFSSMNGVTAKRAGKKVALRSDWEQVKVGIMEEVVRAKFQQNPELRDKLIATGNAQLVEGNYWHDTFWGVDSKTGEGENHLGQILMKVRAELRTSEDVAQLQQQWRMQADKLLKQRQETAATAAGIRRQLAVPMPDLTGTEADTKAFGRVTIQRHEGMYLTFEAGGKERTLAMPDCITKGFLTPMDPGAADAILQRRRLEEELKMLEEQLHQLDDELLIFKMYP